MSDCQQKMDSMVEVSNDVGKIVKIAEDAKELVEIVKRIIASVSDGKGPVVSKEDIAVLRKYPSDALTLFHHLMQMEPKEVSVAIASDQPDLVPTQPFNNINLFERMPVGYVRKQPTSLDDLVKMVQQAGDERKQIKAVGACYSFSNVAFSTDYVIEMNKYLHNILDIDTSLLRDPSDSHVNTLLKVESGTLIEAILEKLWPEDKRDVTTGYRTMMNTTGYSGLSIAGTTGCGAHGSGLDKPPMCDCILSLHLVTLDKNFKVTQYWVEPANGITNPSKFKKKYGKSDLTLIQDDGLFYSCLVHVGTLGVVYSYVIKVQPAFYLKEHRWMQSWDETKKQLPSLMANNLKKKGEEGAIHSFEVWLNPYPSWDLTLSGKKVLSVVSTYSYADPPRVNKRPKAFFASQLENELLSIFTVYASKHWTRFMPEILTIALKATTSKDPVTMPCTEALSFGTPNGIKVVVSDMGVDASSATQVQSAADDVIKVFQNGLQEDCRYFATSPFSLRFTSPSKAYIAPQYNRPSCMIETPILLDTFGQHSSLIRFRSMMENRHKGRPHWGQINDIDFAKFKALYPNSYAKFVKALNKFNVSGLFNNYFTSNTFE